MAPNIRFILFEANFSWIIFFAPGWKKNPWNKYYDFADFYDVVWWLTVVFGLAFFLY